MQPCCWIISGAHSAFQTSTAFSVSDGSILMWMRRMIDMGVLPGVMTDDGTITHNVLVRQQAQNADRIKQTESRFADNHEAFFNTIGQTRSGRTVRYPVHLYYNMVQMRLVRRTTR
jgi:hypothetical protein